MGKTIGSGVVVSIGQGDAATVTDALDTFDAIGGIDSVGAAEEKRDQVDVTTLDSTEREFINGIKDTPEISFELKYNASDAGQASAAAAFDSGQLRNFRIVYTSTPAKTAKFTGVVTEKPNPNVGGFGDALSATLTVQRRGAVTWV